jgi:hypothetical protein
MLENAEGIGADRPLRDEHALGAEVEPEEY